MIRAKNYYNIFNFVSYCRLFFPDMVYVPDSLVVYDDC